MKTKSLFISTVAMVVMLIVALSVGTFAWYTSQNEISTQSVTVAATTTDASAIGIGWTTSAEASTVELKAGTVRPMIPQTKPATNSETEALTFNEALLKTNALGELEISDISDTSVPWKQQENIVEEAATTLYVNNLDINSAIKVTPKVTIPDAAATGDKLGPLLRVALFHKTATENVYLGTWGSDAPNKAYALKMKTAGEAGAPLTGSPDQITVMANEFNVTGSGTAGSVQISLTGGGSAQILIYAWLEGTKLTMANMNFDAAAFTVTFTSQLAE